MKEYTLIIEYLPGRFKLLNLFFDTEKEALKVADSVCTKNDNVFVVQIVAKCFGSLKPNHHNIV